MPQMMCIDEQLVSFKGPSTLKHYLPNKPHKWGYKIYSLCDTNGIMYNFEVHSKAIVKLDRERDLGASDNIVLLLDECILTGNNFLFYFDNWFTSLPLLSTLAKKNIYSLGTVRQN